MAPTPTSCATKAAIHSWTQSLRYQLKATAIEVLELIPPYVATGLMGSHQVADPRAMPLAEFIDETIKVLGTASEEVLVERARPLRNSRREL